MTTISASTILRSRNASQPDKVLSTLLLRYPRFIHAEFMTHRVFSRNAASSRAIPVKKLIQDVIDNPVIPLHWGKNQPGMQAHEECDAPLNVSDTIWGESGNYPFKRDEAWLLAMAAAVDMARAFSDAGYHKQVVNRLLEPFAHITVLVSSTEWDNFLELRDHEDAEPHIRMLAQEIRKCIERKDDIQTLRPGQWHLPFVEDEAADHWMDVYGGGQGYIGDDLKKAQQSCLSDMIKLSVARCASTSYKTVDGFDMTIERAVQLHDKLVAARPIHASPAEHVAQADRWDTGEFGGGIVGLNETGWATPEEHGNFIGFRQYRKKLELGNSL